MNGKVFLVGAGPGDPDLLTVKALRLIESAQVVLHDDLVGPEILRLISSTAHIRNVGKRCGRKSVQQAEINALLVAFASFGVNVVRLKGGDPSIFGRGGEEMDALRKAGVEFEVVPGVTSALASAAAAQVSLTHRNKSSAIILLSSHPASPEQAVAWPAYVASGATLAVYMPGFNYGETAANLISAGLKATTPCAIVSRVSSPQQQIHRTTVAELPSAPLLAAPTLLLIGDVLAEEVAISKGHADTSDVMVASLVDPSDEPRVLFVDDVVPQDREWRQ
jgi:uroporphyrin-III C-methyltransferase